MQPSSRVLKSPTPTPRSPTTDTVWKRLRDEWVRRAQPFKHEPPPAHPYTVTRRAVPTSTSSSGPGSTSGLSASRWGGRRASRSRAILHPRPSCGGFYHGSENPPLPDPHPRDSLSLLPHWSRRAWGSGEGACEKSTASPGLSCRLPGPTLARPLPLDHHGPRTSPERLWECLPNVQRCGVKEEKPPSVTRGLRIS